jgi:hypothetical protein
MMNAKDIADYVAGTMALEKQGLTRKQYYRLLEYIELIMKNGKISRE